MMSSESREELNIEQIHQLRGRVGRRAALSDDLSDNRTLF